MLPSAFLRLHRWLPPSLVFLQESRGYFCPAVRVSGQIDWKQDSPPGREGEGEQEAGGGREKSESGIRGLVSRPLARPGGEESSRSGYFGFVRRVNTNQES